MHRIRMSLPYFEKYGWKSEIVMVHEKFSESTKDYLLVENFPKDIIIHKVNALPINITRKFGLGSLGMRSIYFYKKYMDTILKKKKYDLIYFSTTEFAVTILGAYWKRKFNVPYIIDFQDAWHTIYYQDKPKLQRPPKYWFSYRLHKFLEPKAIKYVDGLISVSQSYIDDLKARYKHLSNTPCEVITFGAFAPDFDFVFDNLGKFKLPYKSNNDIINLVYVGRGGYDLKDALTLLFTAFQKGITEDFSNFNKLRFHFIGTSYAPMGEGNPTIIPVAKEMDLLNYVSEQTDRISYYEGINSLIHADGLIIVGSNDPQYTASKIYPYILANKPIIALFHPESSAFKILDDCNAGSVFSLFKDTNTIGNIYSELQRMIHNPRKSQVDWEKFKTYHASNMTRRQCELFDKVVK